MDVQKFSASTQKRMTDSQRLATFGNMATALVLFMYGIANPRLWGKDVKTASNNLLIVHRMLTGAALVIIGLGIAQSLDDDILLAAYSVSGVFALGYLMTLFEFTSWIVWGARPWMIHALSTLALGYPFYRAVQRVSASMQSRPAPVVVLTSNSGSVVNACKVQLEDPTSASRAAFNAKFAENISPAERVQAVEYIGDEGEPLDKNVWCHLIVRTKPEADPYPTFLIKYAYETGDIIEGGRFLSKDEEDKYRKLAMASP